MQEKFIAILCAAFLMLMSSSLSAQNTRSNYSLEECQELFNKGNISEAISSLNSLREDLESSNNLDNSSYSSVVLMTLTHYCNVGDIAAARDLLSHVLLCLSQSDLISNNELFRMLLIQKGQIEMFLHDYNQAIAYFQKAQWYYEDCSKYDDGYFFALTNLGICYLNLEDYLKAKLYLDEAKTVFEDNFDDLSSSPWPIAMELYYSLGDLERLQKNYPKAINYYKTVIAAAKDDIVLSEAKNIALNDLASTYCAMGEWDEALIWYKQIDSHLSPENRAVLLQNMALCHYFLGKDDLSLKYLNDYNKSALENAQRIFSSFSEVERDEYWNNLGWQLNITNNMMAYLIGSPQVLSSGFTYNTITRRLNNNFYQMIYESARESTDKQNMIQRLNELRGRLSYGCKTIEEHDSIAMEVIHLEREILVETNALNFSSDSTLNCVNHNLNVDDILIDFVFLNYPDSVKTIHENYGAYIIDKTLDHPILLNICGRDEIDKYIDWNKMDEIDINNIYSDSKLYSILFAKISPYLKGKKRIYYRPTGVLSKINISALKNNSGNLLSDSLDVICMSDFSLKNFKSANQYPGKNNIQLYGAINYEKTNNNDFAQYISDDASITILREIDSRGKFGPLPGTMYEVEQIDSIFTSHKIPTITYVGSEASEMTFREMSGQSPGLLHIATHGYYINTVSGYQSSNFLHNAIGYSAKNTNMLFSGLLMAGANRVWNGGELPNPIDDGVLTSDEISRLDLSNTKLVVLSACNTGQGFIDCLDGIMGLQRAFKQAGVDTIVMSLWEIPDVATSFLMTSFYEELLTGSSIREALRRAQKCLIGRGYTDPYYWASFVVLD